MGATAQKMSRRRRTRLSNESEESVDQYKSNQSYANANANTNGNGNGNGNGYDDGEEEEEHINNNKSNSNIQYAPNPIIHSSEYQWQQRRQQRQRQQQQQKWRVRFRTGDANEDRIHERHRVRHSHYYCEEGDEHDDQGEDNNNNNNNNIYNEEGEEEEEDNEGDHNNVVDCETYYHKEEPDCDDEDYNNHRLDDGSNSNSDSEDSDSTILSHRSLQDTILVEDIVGVGRSSNRTDRDSQSDSELETHSAHKRSLHEASASGFRNSNNNNNNNVHRLKQRVPNHRQRKKNPSSSSSFSSNSLLLADIMEGDGIRMIASRSSNKNRNRNKNKNKNNKSNRHSNNTKTKNKNKTIPSKLTRWRPSSIVLLLKTKKKTLSLLLVTSVSIAGVGLYTSSYTALSVALDQVAARTNAQRKQAMAYFDSIENDLRTFHKQLLDLDPDASLLASRTAAEVNGRLLQKVNDDGQENDVAQSGKPRGLSTKTSTTKTITNHGDDRNRNHGIPGFDKLVDEQENRLLDEMVEVKEKLRIEASQKNALEKYIQAISLRDATLKYGTGVIRVQLDLDFPEDRNRNDWDGALSSMSSSPVLVLEMAPLELMPHSVFTFLEMVNARLFDGCSFILNAMNVVKAAPLPYDGSSTSQKVKAFTKLGLDSVSFREYSAEYPHEQFTVGFAADGSPSFYINTDDNTEQHVGEPCFARIVSGFGTVERLEEAPTRNGMWYRKRIGIKRVRIL